MSHDDEAASSCCFGHISHSAQIKHVLRIVPRVCCVTFSIEQLQQHSNMVSRLLMVTEQRDD